MSAPKFSLELALKPYECEQVSPLVRRILCNNPSPFTFKGTMSYLIGRGEVVLVDPGPDDPQMVEAILKALGQEKIVAILITHTHKDHSPNAKYFEVPTFGEGVHRPSRAIEMGEINALDAAGDKDFKPTHTLKDGEKFKLAGLDFEAIATPGHCANHMAFAFLQENSTFIGDHIMSWSTSIVAPPDGAMGDYMASLRKISKREETRLYPGHGTYIDNPRQFTRALITHRTMREASLLREVERGTKTIPEMVRHIYEGLAPHLFNAACLSAYAHLEELVRLQKVHCEGFPQLNSVYSKKPTA